MNAASAHRPWAPAEPVRLTRRGRLAALALLVLLAFAAATILGARSAAVPSRAGLDPTRTVTVQPGQTLWDIAARAAPSADPRETIEAILRVNALDGAGDLRIGERLLVPTGG